MCSRHPAPALLVHKTANVLNQQVALSVQVNMTEGGPSAEYYGAPTRAAAEAAIDGFADKYSASPDKAVACLTKIARRCSPSSISPPSAGTTCAHGTRSRGQISSPQCVIEPCERKNILSPKTTRLMVLKLVSAAAKAWRRLKGENQLPKVVRGVKSKTASRSSKRQLTNAA